MEHLSKQVLTSASFTKGLKMMMNEDEREGKGQVEIEKEREEARQAIREKR